MGKDGVISMSHRQKLDTRSSMTTELAAADNAVVMVSWTKSFLEVQGCIVNKSAQQMLHLHVI